MDNMGCTTKSWVGAYELPESGGQPSWKNFGSMKKSGLVRNNNIFSKTVTFLCCSAHHGIAGTSKHKTRTCLSLIQAKRAPPSSEGEESNLT